MTQREDTRREGNLEALRARLPGLADLVQSLGEVDSPFALVETPSGFPSARMRGGGWLHSSRDPRAEARRLANSGGAGAEPADAVILLGFGLGYLPEALLDRGLELLEAADRVLVCEADLPVLAAALAARDLRGLLSDDRLGFVVGGDPDAVVQALELSGASRAAILSLAAAEASDPAWYGALRGAVGRWNAKGEVNEATLRRFGRLWVRNLARNAERIAACPGVDRLEGIMAGMPALVLAAGPSLDLVLPSIREIAQRAVLVCVDTALRSLLGAGIEPDFLVVMDPQYWNWRHVAGLSSPSSILVSESAAWPAVFRFPARRIFLGGSLFPLGKRIESYAGRKGCLGAGGSVATSAWDLARIMGASPILMAGLDLGYPGGATHAAASLFEQRALASSRRLAPAAGTQAAALLEARPFLAPASGGGSVLTDRRMRLYAWWFESRLARLSAPKTLSLSPGGLSIPGMGRGRIEELLDLPPSRSRIEAGLDAAAAMDAPPHAREKAAAGFQALLDELGEIARTASEAAETAARGRALFASGGNCRAELALLDKADERLLGNASRDLAGFLLPPAGELIGTRASDLGDCLARSEAIYRGVLASASYHLDRLDAASGP